MSSSESNSGIKTWPAPAGVDETLNRLETVAKQKGMTIFARIDFYKDAKAAGLDMQPTQLLILGNPRGGTPLMVAAPSAALDLPLKVLAWRDSAGQSWVSINAPEYLQQRHGFPPALLANIAGLEKLVQTVATADDRA